MALLQELSEEMDRMAEKYDVGVHLSRVFHAEGTPCPKWCLETLTNDGSGLYDFLVRSDSVVDAMVKVALCLQHAEHDSAEECSDPATE
jgi:hypothetical protein